MKRVLSLLLTIAMFVQLLAVPAFADDTQASAALTDGNAAHGETVELTLSLDGLEAAAEVKYPGDGAENFLTPITLLSDTSVDTDMTLDANHPVKLNLTNHTLTVANGTEFTVAQETELHNGTLRVGYGGELAGAEKIREIKNNDEIGKIRYEVALTALVNGKSTDAVKVGDAVDETILVNRSADKTVTDIATAYTIIKDEETPVGSAQNLTDEAGTHTITPKLADEEIRYEVVDELTQSATLTVEKEIIPGEIEYVGFSLNLESEIHYNLSIKLKDFDMEDVEEIGLLRFYTRADNKDDSNYDTADEKTIYDTPEEIAACRREDGAYRLRTSGIPAKTMDDDNWYRAYVKLVDGTIVYSNRYKFDARAFAETVLNNSKYSDEFKAACVALMNYGAAAQVQFNYNTETLMNEFINQKDKQRVKPFETSMIDARVDYDNSKHGAFVTDKTMFASGYKANLTLLGAITLNVKVPYTSKNVTETGMLVWKEDVYQDAEGLSWDNAEVYKSEAADQILLNYAGLAAKDMGETIFMCGYALVDDAYSYTGLFRLSIDYYAQKILDGDYDAAMKVLAREMVVYGEYARDYLKTLN